MAKEILAGLAGMFDPVIRRLAQKLSAHISAENPLRSPGVESIVGALKGAVESYAEKFPDLVAVAVEKFTDFSDFLSVSLAQGQSGGQIRRAWQEKFLAQALERLKQAADPEAELEKVKTELNLYNELFRLVFGDGGQEKISNQLGKVLSKLAADLKKTDATTAEKMEAWRQRQKWIRRGR